jgi:hypothetical protein
MSAFAFLAACGTTGYSIIDDAALRTLRSQEILGGRVPVSVISFFYLFLEVSLTVPWLAFFFHLERKISRKTTHEQTGYRHFFMRFFWE